MDKEIQKIVESFGATLYDTELESVDESHIFRVPIQKEGGVDLDLCSSISHVLSPYLDTNPPVKGKYFLEVSSAGIERNLCLGFGRGRRAEGHTIIHLNDLTSLYTVLS